MTVVRIPHWLRREGRHLLNLELGDRQLTATVEIASDDLELEVTGDIMGLAEPPGVDSRLGVTRVRQVAAELTRTVVDGRPRYQITNRTDGLELRGTNPDGSFVGKVTRLDGTDPDGLLGRCGTVDHEQPWIAPGESANAGEPHTIGTRSPLPAGTYEYVLLVQTRPLGSHVPSDPMVVHRITDRFTIDGSGRATRPITTRPP